jgi:hypothetical protein
MLFNHGTRHEALIANSVFGKFKKVVNYKKFKNEKQKKKVSPKAILQENVLKRNKIRRTNSKVFHK